MSFKDELNAIVADVSAGSFKAGFAGADMPTAWMPSLVGVDGGAYSTDISTPRAGCALRGPFDSDGALVQDWGAMEVCVCVCVCVCVFVACGGAGVVLCVLCWCAW
jgi:hypothetical protein